MIQCWCAYEIDRKHSSPKSVADCRKPLPFRKTAERIGHRPRFQDALPEPQQLCSGIDEICQFLWVPDNRPTLRDTLDQVDDEPRNRSSLRGSPTKIYEQ